MMFLVFYYVITLLSEFCLQNVELSGRPVCTATQATSYLSHMLHEQQAGLAHYEARQFLLLISASYSSHVHRPAGI